MFDMNAVWNLHGFKEDYAQRQDPIGRSPSTTVPTPVGKPGCIGFAKEPVITFWLKMPLTIVVVPFATNKLRPMILCPLWRIWRITSRIWLWISAEHVELLGSDEISCRGAGLKMYKVYEIIRNYTKLLAVLFHTFPYGPAWWLADCRSLSLNHFIVEPVWVLLGTGCGVLRISKRWLLSLLRPRGSSDGKTHVRHCSFGWALV